MEASQTVKAVWQGDIRLRVAMKAGKSNIENQRPPPLLGAVSLLAGMLKKSWFRVFRSGPFALSGYRLLPVPLVVLVFVVVPLPLVVVVVVVVPLPLGKPAAFSPSPTTVIPVKVRSCKVTTAKIPKAAIFFMGSNSLCLTIINF